MSGAGAASGARGNGDGRKFLDPKLQEIWDGMQSELNELPDVVIDGRTITITPVQDVAKTALPAFASHVATQTFHGKKVTAGDEFKKSLCISLTDAVEKNDGPAYEHKGLRESFTAAETPDMVALQKLYRLLFKHVCAVLLPNAGNDDVVVISDSDSD